MQCTIEIKVYQRIQYGKESFNLIKLNLSEKITWRD